MFQDLPVARSIMIAIGDTKLLRQMEVVLRRTLIQPERILFPIHQPTGAEIAGIILVTAIPVTPLQTQGMMAEVRGVRHLLLLLREVHTVLVAGLEAGEGNQF
jgi:hypothetical protein